MDKPTFIILKQYDTAYALAVLAHGGGDTFPSLEGICLGCDTKVFYDSILAGKVKCPECGGEIKRTGSQNFSRYTDLVSDWCPYLRRHAKGG